MNITPEELAAMEAAEAARTQGEWLVRPDDYDDWGFVRSGSRGQLIADFNELYSAAWADRMHAEGKVGSAEWKAGPPQVMANAKYVEVCTRLVNKLLTSYREVVAERDEVNATADWLEAKFNKLSGKREELRQSLESVNELAREYGFGQGELDEDLTGCLRKSIEQQSNQLTEARAEAEMLRAAITNIRDSVLNNRYQLAEMDVDSDITNAVLGIIDDNTPPTKGSE